MASEFTEIVIENDFAGKRKSERQRRSHGGKDTIIDACVLGNCDDTALGPQFQETRCRNKQIVLVDDKYDICMERNVNLIVLPNETGSVLKYDSFQVNAMQRPLHNFLGYKIRHDILDRVANPAGGGQRPSGDLVTNRAKHTNGTAS